MDGSYQKTMSVKNAFLALLHHIHGLSALPENNCGCLCQDLKPADLISIRIHCQAASGDQVRGGQFAMYSMFARQTGLVRQSVGHVSLPMALAS